MLMLVNSVDTDGAILAVLVARKKPYILSLVAKSGVTQVAKFVVERFQYRAEAEGEMYNHFDTVNHYSNDVPQSVCDTDRIFSLMRISEKLFGDCAFSVVVEKMEV